MDMNGVLASVYDPVNNAVRVSTGSGAPGDATYITATANSTLSNEILFVTAVNRGTDAARTASTPSPGWLWFTTDTSINYWYSGSAWFEVSRGIGSLDARYDAAGAAATAQAAAVQRANHTGTQLMSTISDAGALATLSAVGSAQITNGSVANADLADMANATVKGRNTAGTGAPEDVTMTQLKTLLALAAANISDFDTQVATTAVLKSLADAKGDVFAATADNTVTRLAVGTDGQVLQADSTQSTGLKWYGRSRALSEAHAQAGVVNDTTETTLFTFALPATLAAGDVVSFKAYGDMLNNSGGLVTFQPRMKLGATTVLAGTAISVIAGANRRSWVLDGSLLVVATNDQRLGVQLAFSPSSATVWAPGNTATSGNGYIGSGLGTATEDLTSSKNLVFTIQLGTAVSTADFYLRMANLQVAKA